MELKLTYVLQQHNKFQVYILSALKRLAHKHLEFFFSWMYGLNEHRHPSNRDSQLKQ